MIGVVMPQKNVFISNRSSGSVDLLQDASVFFFTSSSPGRDSVLKIPKRRNKKQTNEHMNEQVLQCAEVLM